MIDWFIHCSCDWLHWLLLLSNIYVQTPNDTTPRVSWLLLCFRQGTINHGNQFNLFASWDIAKSHTTNNVECFNATSGMFLFLFDDSENRRSTVFNSPSFGGWMDGWKSSVEMSDSRSRFWTTTTTTTTTTTESSSCTLWVGGWFQPTFMDHGVCIIAVEKQLRYQTQIVTFNAAMQCDAMRGGYISVKSTKTATKRIQSKTQHCWATDAFPAAASPITFVLDIDKLSTRASSSDNDDEDNRLRVILFVIQQELSEKGTIYETHTRYHRECHFSGSVMEIQT